VATVRDTDRVLGSFVEYYRRSGFDRLYLFFDDPAEWARDVTARDDDLVLAVPVDDSLRARWRSCQAWSEMGPHVATEVMARQVLNVDVALALAQEDDITWLFHVDLDELLFSPVPFGQLVTSAEENGHDSLRFHSWEAVPERMDVDDYLREVTLFKRNPLAVAADGIDLTATWPSGRPYFVAYSNTKAAVRVADDVRASGPHEFVSPSRQLQVGTFQRGPVVLHFVDCGFEHYWRKYRTLGAFGDRWYGEYDIASRVPFHLVSRDAITRGDREAAEELYRSSIMIDDPVLVDRLLASGVLYRFDPWQQLEAPTTPEEVRGQRGSVA
jgi:hypothetical protein